MITTAKQFIDALNFGSSLEADARIVTFSKALQSVSDRSIALYCKITDDDVIELELVRHLARLPEDDVMEARLVRKGAENETIRRRLFPARQSTDAREAA